MKKTVLGLALALILSVVAATIYAQSATIWVCSNHNPAHTATSAAQIQDLTNRYGCTGWYRLK